MALEITGIKRVFTFKKGTATITLDDPNPSDSPEMVMGFYSNTYPELTTATVHGPTMKDDAAVYEFKTTIGTKAVSYTHSPSPRDRTRSRMPSSA